MANKPYYAEGVYVAEVTQQGLSTVESSGNHQIVIRAKILGVPDEQGGYIPEHNSYDRTVYMVITEKTCDFVVENLRKMGFDGDSFAQIDPENPKCISMVGNQVSLYCKHEVDRNGSDRERWQVSKGAGAMTIKPPEPSAIRKLDQMFGASFRKAPKAQASPHMQGRAAAVPNETQSPYDDEMGITDDDIPF